MCPICYLLYVSAFRPSSGIHILCCPFVILYVMLQCAFLLKRITYNPDVIIGTESWLIEEISNAEVFRDNYTTFRRDWNAWGGGVFICVKDYIFCVELWADEDFEMLAVEVKGRDPKFIWKIEASTELGTRTCEQLKDWQPEPIIQEILQNDSLQFQHPNPPALSIHDSPIHPGRTLVHKQPQDPRRSANEHSAQWNEKWKTNT
jgi:hypothetical protein